MSDKLNVSRESIKELVRSVLDSNDQFAPPEPSGPEHLLVNSLREKAERKFDRDESAKSLITEDELRGLDEGARLRVSAGVKFTPLAQDIINDRRIELVERPSRESRILVRSVALGSDHGGFEAKEALKIFLSDTGLNVRDFGTNSPDPVDYPDIAHEVAMSVGSGHTEIGILIDGAGIGSAMAANKVPKVRAAACYSVTLARNAREHNGANILTLASGQNPVEELRKIVEAFISTEISEPRHQRRVAKIDDMDRQYRR